MAELERIVLAMEAGQMTLADSLSAYQRGVTLLSHCQGTLTAAEQQIKVLEGEVMRRLDQLDDQTTGTSNTPGAD